MTITIMVTRKQSSVVGRQQIVFALKAAGFDRRLFLLASISKKCTGGGHFENCQIQEGVILRTLARKDLASVARVWPESADD
jgi:hypothetical protein